MTPNTPAKIARCALLAAPLVIAPATFLALIPWLKQQPGAIALWAAAATAIFVMGYAIFLSARVSRRLDEVEIAGKRFATAQGWVIGIFAAGLVMVFPPAINALADLAIGIGAGSPEKAVRVAIVIGFVMVTILQTLGIFAASAWWGRRLGRAE